MKKGTIKLRPFLVLLKALNPQFQFLTIIQFIDLQILTQVQSPSKSQLPQSN